MVTYKFVFLRTRIAVDHADESLRALAEYFPYPDPPTTMELMLNRTDHIIQYLGFGRDAATWEDGVVIRFKTKKAPVDVEYALRPALDKFDGWLIHDSRDKFCESPTGGPLDRFFHRLWGDDYNEMIRSPYAAQLPISQIFVMGRDDDKNYESTVNNIRTSMAPGCLCLPVFYFRSGQILFLNSKESGNITIKRCGHHLRRLEHWSIIDSLGDSYSTKGREESTWVETDLSDLRFTDGTD
jgi:hypothetical protein